MKPTPKKEPCIISGLYRYTPSVPEPNLCWFICFGESCQGLLILHLKKKSESYIFYKLSAVKEGAKIKTINTVHNYLFLLPQLRVVVCNTSPDLHPNQMLNTLKSDGKRNPFRSLNVKTLTHTRLWHNHVTEECLQCMFFYQQWKTASSLSS